MSKFRPSALTRVAACPGSVSLVATLPEDQQTGPSSAAAETGTLRHALLESKIKQHLTPWEPADLTGLTRPPVAEDWAAVDQLFAWVSQHPAFVKHGQPGHRAWSEVKLEIGKYCGLSEGELAGTADVVLATPTRLTVFDAKFGYKKVMPNTLQLKAYAVGAGALLANPGAGEFLPEFRGVREIELVIGQPAVSGIDSVVFPLTHLQQWAQEIRAVCWAASAPDPTFAAGDQCTFCPAALVCPHRRAAADAAVTGIFDVVEGADAPRPAQSQGDAAPLLAKVEELTSLSPEGLTPDQFGKILDLAPVVEALFKDLRTEAMRRIKEGEAIPGWALGEGKRSREWTLDKEKVPDALTKIGLKAGEIWVKTLATPAQLETVVKGHGQARRIAAFSDLWRWKPGSPVLVPAGAAVDSVMFDKVTGETPAAAASTEEPKPKRKRRTKAEMEAARAAEKNPQPTTQPSWL